MNPIISKVGARNLAESQVLEEKEIKKEPSKKRNLLEKGLDRKSDIIKRLERIEKIQGILLNFIKKVGN